MRRSIARIAFFIALFAAGTALPILAQPWLGGWHAGVAGGFGALTFLFGLRWFDRLWPKPMKGWAE